MQARTRHASMRCRFSRRRRRRACYGSEADIFTPMPLRFITLIFAAFFDFR